jgi:site-specific DNA recombinase
MSALGHKRIALHPAVEEQLTNRQQALDGGARAGDSECGEAIRDLVETVTVFRDMSKPGGVEVEIVGRLTALLGERAYPNGVKGVWGKMVAEEGLARW